MNTIKTILLIFILSSCCKSSLIDTIRFSESDLQVNPYTGNETLEFIDDNNNIITYNNGYRRINQEEVEECDGGCCDYYLVERFDNTFFESTYMESNLQVIINNPFDKYRGTSATPSMYFAWDYYEIKPYVTSTNFGSLPVDSMKQAAIEEEIFKDSLILRDNKYYNIYTLPGRCTYEDRLYGDTLFFSESEGIIGIRFTDGNLWTIKK